MLKAESEEVSVSVVICRCLMMFDMKDEMNEKVFITRLSTQQWSDTTGHFQCFHFIYNKINPVFLFMKKNMKKNMKESAEWSFNPQLESSSVSSHVV